MSWLFPFEDGAPPIGWHDALAYLVLPVLLVVSQYVSQKIMQPQTQDGSQKQAQAILSFLPVMIGKHFACFVSAFVGAVKENDCLKISAPNFTGNCAT